MRVASSGNVLIVYALQQHPVLGTVRDHLESFARHSVARCHYLNLSIRRPPRWLLRVPFDLVVFHTSFLSHLRWDPANGARLLERAAPLRELHATKAALPQDEFLRSAAINEFIEAFSVDVVFSVADASQWPVIYDTVDRDRVRFSTVLTGYLLDQTVARIGDVVRATPERTVDVGYRAFHAPAWLGRHGQLKTAIASVVGPAAYKRGLRVDVSTRPEDTLYGDDWLRFLARSRYTLGVEGGASILDRDGSVRATAERYAATHPSATFDEIEAACFPNRDGELTLTAISPRHLEACAARTCQVLVEGHYNGILQAGTHYLALKRDFSNLEDVLDEMFNAARRAQVVEAAYADVVASGRFTYQAFVRQVERECGLNRASTRARALGARTVRAAVAADRLSWLGVRWVAVWRPWLLAGWERAAPRLGRIVPTVVRRLAGRLTQRL
jgi:hypothetical protein